MLPSELMCGSLVRVQKKNFSVSVQLQHRGRSWKSPGSFFSSLPLSPPTLEKTTNVTVQFLPIPMFLLFAVQWGISERTTDQTSLSTVKYHCKPQIRLSLPYSLEAPNQSSTPSIPVLLCRQLFPPQLCKEHRERADEAPGKLKLVRWCWKQ